MALPDIKPGRNYGDTPQSFSRDPEASPHIGPDLREIELAHNSDPAIKPDVFGRRAALPSEIEAILRRR